MTKTQAWIGAFRLRTLPLSLAGILMGTAIAKSQGFWDTRIFCLALSTTLLFQILSNLANDLGDSMKGTDNSSRIGPVRAVQSGMISKKEMKGAVVLFALLSFVSAGFLIYFGTQQMPKEILYVYAGLAVLCVIAAITYTMGKKAYGYSGFGDLFVFVFFGLVSVLGVYSLYTKTIDWHNLLPACSMGLLSAAVLNLNNMRDRVNDAKSGKNTLVVKIGPNYAKMYHALLIIGGIATLLAFIFPQSKEIKLYLITLIPAAVLIYHLRVVMNTKVEKEFDSQLKVVALSTFAVSLFFLIATLFTEQA